MNNNKKILKLSEKAKPLLLNLEMNQVYWVKSS